MRRGEPVSISVMTDCACEIAAAHVSARHLLLHPAAGNMPASTVGDPSTILPEASSFGLAPGLTRPRAARLPLSLTLILLTLFLPEGSSFFVSGLRLTFTRLIFLVLTPVVFMKWGQKISSGSYRFVASDLFVFLTAFWMFLGPSVTYSFGDALQHSGPVVLEYLIAYMSTRFLLSSHGQAVVFVSLLCLIISIVVVDASLDILTGRYVTRIFVDQLTGYNKVWNAADEFRFGLLRAAGPVEHPILFGFACGIGLVLAAAVKIKRRKFCLALCGLGVAISFSSAPQQSAVMGLGLLCYDRLFSRLPHKWLILSLPPVIAFGSLAMATKSPFGHLFDVLTIDPQTAYYRLYIWNSIGPLVLESPFFGVSLDASDYQGSVDSLWLVLSLVYGVPCAILTALSLIGCCSLSVSGRSARLALSEVRLGLALGIVMFLIIFMGFTVHFWGSVWILIGLLTGLRAHIGELGRLGVPTDRASGNSLGSTKTSRHSH